MDLLASYNAVIVLIGVNAVLAYSMYAVLVAGQLSLAQGAFASIAAYTSAILTIEATWPLPIVIVVGSLTGALVALILGLPVLRLRGVFLAIATLGFGEMVRILAINIDITGGPQGLRGIPKLIGIAEVVIAVLLVAWFFARMRGTRLGRGLAAVREDEIAAEVSGIDVVRYRMYSFVTSGAFAGVSGVLFAHFTRYISPDQFGFLRALDALLYAIVGGTAHWSGPLLGAGFLTLLPEVQREFGFTQPWIRPAVSGLILLLVILFLPEGLVGLGRVRRRLWASAGGRGRAAREADGPVRRGDERQSSSPSDEAADARLEHPSGEVLVDLRDVSKDYGGVVAVSGVSLELRAGEIVGLIGPNGAGKTTLVNVITGLTSATRGRVDVVGTPVTPGTRVHQIAARGVSRTFQQVRLFDGLTVIENVLIGAHLQVRPTFLRRLFLLPSARNDEASARQQARAALEVVGLADRADQPATGLSYGDRRRLEIARALANEPKLLVLDEPAAGMNHVEGAQLGELIRRIAGRGVTVLLIEHNVRLVMNTCSRVVVVDFGVVIADDAPDVVAHDPQVVAAYLGDETEEKAL